MSNQIRFLKWAGSKWRLLSIIKPLIPTGFNTYYEPFLGGGAVYFGIIQPMQHIGITSHLSDINDRLINAYRCVRDQPQTVESLLQAWPNNRSTYYQIRDGDYVVPPHQAAQFIYINKTGFNGLWRVNKSGKCNVSYSGAERGKSHFPNVVDVSRVLQHTDIQCKTYRDVTPEGEAFMYCDPPYDTPDRIYTEHRFNQEEFSKWAGSVSCKMMVSQLDSDYIRELYRGWTFHELTLRHEISANPHGRRNRRELLITNY